MNKTKCDVAIVGAGPNGLTAAAVLAAAGLAVTVFERNDRIGGGSRTEALTLPGFAHDVCGAIHPIGSVSPIFSRLDLGAYGLKWVAAPVPLAHPLDDGRVAVLSRELERTVASLGEDGPAWRGLLGPFVARHEALFSEILRPIRVPRHPLLMARFGLVGLRSCAAIASRFKGAAARALLAGNGAHSFLPLDAWGSASFGLILAIAAHAMDWPCAEGGSQQIVEALAARARAHGCRIETSSPILSLRDLPPAKAVLFDVTPRQLDDIAGPALSSSYRAQLHRFRYGPGAFKVDYALAGPIPWRSPECTNAATVHVGGTFEEIAASEADATAGRICEKPFVLVAQQSQFDPTRAPAGQQTGWAYCHVPNGSYRGHDRPDRASDRALRAGLPRSDPRAARAAAGRARSAQPQPDRRRHRRRIEHAPPVPVSSGAPWNPYATSDPRYYLCSSSTPPGGGVHGMCGYWAARTALARVFGKRVPAELAI